MNSPAPSPAQLKLLAAAARRALPADHAMRRLLEQWSQDPGNKMLAGIFGWSLARTEEGRDAFAKVSAALLRAGAGHFGGGGGSA